jgi:hypothetical protein
MAKKLSDSNPSTSALTSNKRKAEEISSFVDDLFIKSSTSTVKSKEAKAPKPSSPELKKKRKQINSDQSDTKGQAKLEESKVVEFKDPELLAKGETGELQKSKKKRKLNSAMSKEERQKVEREKDEEENLKDSRGNRIRKSICLFPIILK